MHPFLDLFLSVCSFLDLFFSVCSFLDLFLSVCSFLDLFLSVCPFLDFFLSVCPFLNLFFSVCVHVQSLNFLRMSARVDGVASRVQSAIQMRQVRGARHVGLSPSSDTV